MGACTAEKEPSAPDERANAASIATPSTDDYARFEADVITSMHLDTTALELAGGMTDKDPERRRVFRDGARRPLVAAYHLAYIDSAGSVSVILSPPSASALRGKDKPTFLKWDKIAQIRMTAGEVLPQITMRDGTVLAAEIPSDFRDMADKVSRGKGSSRMARGKPIGDSQLRALLTQYVRRTPDSPARRKDNETRDSVRLAKGHSRQWQRANDNFEFVARQEMRRESKPGQPLHRLVIEVQNVLTAGSAERLAGER